VLQREKKKKKRKKKKEQKQKKNKGGTRLIKRGPFHGGKLKTITSPLSH